MTNKQGHTRKDLIIFVWIDIPIFSFTVMQIQDASTEIIWTRIKGGVKVLLE